MLSGRLSHCASFFSVCRGLVMQFASTCYTQLLLFTPPPAQPPAPYSGFLLIIHSLVFCAFCIMYMPYLSECVCCFVTLCIFYCLNAEWNILFVPSNIKPFVTTNGPLFFDASVSKLLNPSAC